MRELHQVEDGLWWCSYGCGPFRRYENAKQHTCSKKMIQRIKDVAKVTLKGGVR